MTMKRQRKQWEEEGELCKAATKKPMHTHGKPMAIQAKQSNGNKPSERLWGNKENSGRIKSAMEAKSKKPMITQGIGNKPKERQWKTKKTMGGTRRIMEATPKKPMGTQGKPHVTQSKATETNPNKDYGKTKKTMGGARRIMEATPKKPMGTQRKPISWYVQSAGS